MMNNLMSFVASYLMNAVWEVILIACAGWLANRLLRRVGPQAEHIGWVATLVAALVAPALPLLRGQLALLPGFSSNAGNISVAIVDAAPHAASPRGLLVWPVGLAVALLLCYGGMLVYFAARFVRSLVGAVSLNASAKQISLTPQQQELWHRCERAFSLNGVRLGSAQGIDGPVTLGFRTPTLLLPARFVAESSDQELLAAFAHECAHIERRDFLKNLGIEIASIFLAFHPAVWLIRARIAQSREMLCDRLATERVIDPRMYSHSLLRLAERMAFSSQVRHSQAIGIFDANILEKRIMVINSKKRTIGPAARYGLMVPAALCILFTTLAASAFAIVVRPASQSGQARESAYGPVYKIGHGVTAPTIVHAQDAEYPESAKHAKPPIDCVVVVGLIVDKTGAPQGAHIVKSFRKDFDEEAMKAVRRYKFKPAQKGKVPVAVAINMEVNFRWY